MKTYIKYIATMLILSISITTIHAVRKLDRPNNGSLTTAAWQGDKELVARLVEKRTTNINATTNFGRTALMLAAYKGERDIVKTLINNHANLNIRDKYGRTALMLAAWNNKRDIVKILIENGADKTITDNYGRTALEVAQNQEVKDLILQARIK